jgi:hypothetical protein
MGGRVVTFGEVMLRLKSPGLERFFQSPVLEATFGDGEQLGNFPGLRDSAPRQPNCRRPYLRYAKPF